LSKKSLRKRKKSLQQEKEKANLHLVAGEYKLNHTHSITPISADELEKIYNINPEYVDRLLNIVEDSLKIEKEENEKFYKAIDKEQENEKLEIIKKHDIANKSLIFASIVIVIFMTIGSILLYFGHEYVGGAMLTTVIATIIKAIFLRKKIEE